MQREQIKNITKFSVDRDTLVNTQGHIYDNYKLQKEKKIFVAVL